MPPPDPRIAKRLADLLALTLAESEAEANAALAALRRQSERDGLTAGMIKHYIGQLAADSPPAGPGAVELKRLHDTIEIQRRELATTRQSLSRAETTLAMARLAEATARSQPVAAPPARRGWFTGFLVGLGLGLGVLAATLALGPARPRTAHRLAMPAASRVARFLDQCAMLGGNGLAGEQMRVHLWLAIGPDGHILSAHLAPDPAGFHDPEQQDYAEAVARTLDGGSCGRLPLPASWRGRSGLLDLYLPR